MRPVGERWWEAGCRLTSRQTTGAANVAEREVLMACCQGDMDQSGSVSFADANETSELRPTLAMSPLETQTEPLLPREQLLHTPELKRERMRNNLFAFHVCLWFASFVPCLTWLLWERKIAHSFQVSNNPHIDIFPPFLSHRFPVLNWPFQSGGLIAACAVE